MALDMSYKGKEIAQYTFDVERSKIKELCMAIGDENPIFYDSKAAQEAGYKDTPAPLTFGTLMSFWGNPGIWDKMTTIGIDIKRLLHAKEDYEYLTPYYPGDQLSAVVTVDSLRDGAMQMATFKTVFSRETEDVLIAKMTIMVPPAKGDKK